MRAFVALIKSHTVVGDSLCFQPAVAPDGAADRASSPRAPGWSGYPDGLSGDDIPLIAQIVAIVDIFDAVTSVRPNHQKSGREEAHTVLRREVERGWRRADLVEAFIDTVETSDFSVPEPAGH